MSRRAEDPDRLPPRLYGRLSAIVRRFGTLLGLAVAAGTSAQAHDGAAAEREALQARVAVVRTAINASRPAAADPADGSAHADDPLAQWFNWPNWANWNNWNNWGNWGNWFNR